MLTGRGQRRCSAESMLASMPFNIIDLVSNFDPSTEHKWVPGNWTLSLASHDNDQQHKSTSTVRVPACNTPFKALPGTLEIDRSYHGANDVQGTFSPNNTAAALCTINLFWTKMMPHHRPGLGKRAFGSGCSNWHAIRCYTQVSRFATCQ